MHQNAFVDRAPLGSSAVRRLQHFSEPLAGLGEEQQLWKGNKRRARNRSAPVHERLEEAWKEVWKTWVFDQSLSASAWCEILSKTND